MNSYKKYQEQQEDKEQHEQYLEYLSKKQDRQMYIFLACLFIVLPVIGLIIGLIFN